jgi:hypothetical protein
LAGAQALPTDPASAYAIAKDYGAKNGGTGVLSDADITISTTYRTNDTISVQKTQPTEGFFGKIFGISVVNVHANATAILGVPREALYVAPIAVNILHPDLTGAACGHTVSPDPHDRQPCYGKDYPTTLPLDKTGAPGAFDLINLNCGDIDANGYCTDTQGTVGASTMSSWIQNGYDKYLPLGGYYSDPGAKYNSSNVGQAIQARIGRELLLPVYDTLTGTGSNAAYHVVAWVGFNLLPGSTFDGSSGSLTGYFTRVVWQGLVPPDNGGDDPPIDLGVGVPVLVR